MRHNLREYPLLAIDPLVWRERLAAVDAVTDAGIYAAKVNRDVFGAELPKFEVKDGVAILPVRGAMLPSVSPVFAMLGFTGYDTIRTMADEARTRDDVGAVLVHLDTPGGTVSGLPETAAAFRKLSEAKETIGFSDTIAASAGTWLASSLRGFVLTPSAATGSVGVVSRILDESEAYRQHGYKVEVFTNKGATMKGAGSPGTSLTPEQRSEWQRLVDDAGEDFHAAVRAGRPRVKADVFKAGMYVGRRAVEAGLADAVVESRDAVLRDLLSLFGR